MRFLFVLTICLFFSIAFFAQSTPSNYQLSGQVVEKQTGKSIPFATVIVSNDSIQEKKMLACDGSGNFSVIMSSASEYQLMITAVGYKTHITSIRINDLKTELGKILMDEGVEMKEVTVAAQKPLVKMDVDKITYSIESDPESQTNNTLEMLRKVPLITVDGEDNITLNGQSNFKVLVNGKSSSMMSTNLKDVLKSLPANTIKDIEVITNPSSKYDAEGVGGIINIITSKKTINGYNGSISTGVDSRGSFNASTYMATKINKFSISGRYHANQFRQPESEFNSNNEYYYINDYRYSQSKGKNTYKGLSNGFSGEASYEIDSLNLISLSFWGYQGSYRSNGFNETFFRNTESEITRHYTSRNSSKNSYGTLSGNVDYQKTYKKPDKTLTFSYKLDNNPNTTKSNSLIEGIVNYPSYRQWSENEAVGREQTFQIDYYDPLTKMHQMEGGVKFILRQNESESETFRDDVPNVKGGNDLDYNQYILGAYLGYVFKWKKLSTKTGLRLERTWNDGVSTTSGNNTNFTNRLFNLVPYITLSVMTKPGQTYRLSYTQRLSRPGIWYLNPYVNSIDSMNISFGNPKLKSEISHSFELGYSHFTPKFNFSVTSSAAFVNNSIEQITEIKDNGSTVSTYENIGKNQRYGLNLYVNYRPTQKINIYFNGGGNYSKLEANNGYTIANEGFSFRGYMGGRWMLWKDGSISANGGLFSSGVMLQGKSSNFYYTSFGVSQYFLKRKLMVSASASDPFWHKKKYSYEMKDASFYSNSEYSQLARSFRFNLTYNFGKMDLQVKKARRGIQNDDVKSGGESQGSTGTVTQ